MRPGTLAEVPLATGSQLLSAHYQQNLVKGLSLSSVVLAAGLGIYWGASAMTPPSPPLREIEIDIAALEPELVDVPPAERAPPLASTYTPSGLPRATPDHQVAPDQDVRLQNDHPGSSVTDVGDAIGVVDDGGAVAASRLSPIPANDPPAIDTPPEIFQRVEHMPELIGGLASIQPEYPDLERRIGLEGRVFLQFVVHEDGSVSDVVVTRGVSPGLDRAAVEAVERVRFRPGIQAGRPVKVRFALPINFRLR